MTIAKIVLGLSTLAWTPYGVACFFSPALLENGGIAFSSPTGSTEIRAMYGGLQIGIGILSALGFAIPSWRQSALRTLLCLGAGLFTTRLAGFALDGGLSGYTAGALIFEAILAASAYFALGSEQRAG